MKQKKNRYLILEYAYIVTHYYHLEFSRRYYSAFYFKAITLIMAFNLAIISIYNRLAHEIPPFRNFRLAAILNSPKPGLIGVWWLAPTEKLITNIISCYHWIFHGTTLIRTKITIRNRWLAFTEIISNSLHVNRFIFACFFSV